MTTTNTPTSGAADLRTAAQAVVDRWDTPLWKDVPATAEYIGRLRAALAAWQATAAQQGAYAALPESFLEIPDVQDESGINAYYSREVVLECIDAALASHGQAPAGARYEKGLEDALRERDEADDCIDTLLDEVLGADRAEWSSAYGRADALEEVRERITALHKPAVERAWKQFEAATKQPGDVVAYLDVGAGGCLDLDAALSDEAMQQLPKGRHALVIAGTYGIDGYVAAPQPSTTAQADSVQEDAARYQLLRRGQHWSVIDGGGNELLNEALDHEVDAARKQARRKAMRSALLLAAVAGMVASSPMTAFAPPRANPQPRRLYTSADDERKAMAQAKRDRKAAARAAQKEGEKP